MICFRLPTVGYIFNNRCIITVLVVCITAKKISEDMRYPDPRNIPIHSCQMWCSHSGVMNITLLDLTPCCLAGDLTYSSSWVGGRLVYYTTKHYIPEGSYLYSYRHVNFKSRRVIVYGKAIIRVNVHENLKSHSYRSWCATLLLFNPEDWSNFSEISVNYQPTQHHTLEDSFLFFLVHPSVICVCLVHLSMALQPSVGPWPLFSFLILRQLVRLLGWEISPSQGLYLYTEQHKHRINANRHPCLEWDSNPRSQCSSGRRQFMP
jgi:hypothetical protein